VKQLLIPPDANVHELFGGVANGVWITFGLDARARACAATTAPGANVPWWLSQILSMAAYITQGMTRLHEGHFFAAVSRTRRTVYAHRSTSNWPQEGQ
jgi:hypothetical protein